MAEGLLTVLGLFVIAVAFPRLGEFYWHGPLASEGIDSEALPASALVVLITLLVGRAIRLRPWIAATAALLFGEAPILFMGWIS